MMTPRLSPPSISRPGLPPRPVAPAPAPKPAAAPALPAGLNAAEYLTPAEAASYLRVNVKVLERWRGAGGGPSFLRFSRKTIRYRAADLDAFAAQATRTSTAA